MMVLRAEDTRSRSFCQMPRKGPTGRRFWALTLVHSPVPSREQEGSLLGSEGRRFAPALQRREIRLCRPVMPVWDPGTMGAIRPLDRFIRRVRHRPSEARWKSPRSLSGRPFCPC